MTKEEAKIVQEQIKTMERYIIHIVTSHIKALKGLIDNLTQKE